MQKVKKGGKYQAVSIFQDLYNLCKMCVSSSFNELKVTAISTHGTLKVWLPISFLNTNTIAT